GYESGTQEEQIDETSNPRRTHWGAGARGSGLSGHAPPHYLRGSALPRPPGLANRRDLWGRRGCCPITRGRNSRSRSAVQGAGQMNRTARPSVRTASRTLERQQAAGVFERQEERVAAVVRDRRHVSPGNTERDSPGAYPASWFRLTRRRK